MTMKNFVYLTGCLVLLAQISCGPGEAQKEEPSSELSLEGTWRLVEMIDNLAEDTDVTDGEETIYLKHISPTHFTWISYDKVGDKLNGTGGGTYTLKGNIYTEDIKFFILQVLTKTVRPFHLLLK